LLGFYTGIFATPRQSRGKPAGNPRRLPPLVTVVLVLLVGLAFLYPELLFKKQVFASSDASNADAFRTVGDVALADGQYPLWNPYLFSGMPTFGSLAYTRFLYPPSLFFDFIQQKLGFAPLTWMFVHLLFGGLGMAYLLSRWRLPTAALVLGALVWIMAPKIVAWGVHGHGSKLGAAMFIPWIVAGSLDVLEGRGARAVALTGLLLSLQILRSHFQITYYTLLVIGFLAVCAALFPTGLREVAMPKVLRWRRVAALTGAIVLAFLLGAVLLLPVSQYAPLSIRGSEESGGGAAYEYATGWSLAPSEWPTLLFPSATGFGRATYLGLMPFTDYPNYFGWLLLLLAVTAWWFGRKRLVLAFSVIAVLALLVSAGKHGLFLYDLLYRILPYFNKFRVPSMILILPVFVVALLSAFGAATLTRPDFTAKRWFHWLPWIKGGLGILLLLGGSGLFRNGYQNYLQTLAQQSGKNPPNVLLTAAWNLFQADLIRIGLILLVAGAALFYAHKNVRFRQQGLLWVLVVLVACDLFSVDRRIVYPEKSLLEVVADSSGRPHLVAASRLVRPYRPTDSSAGLQGDFDLLQKRVGHDRLWPLGPNFDGKNLLMTQGIRSLDGYHPAKLASYEEIRRRIRLQHTQRPAGRVASWLSGRIVSLGQRLNSADLQYIRDLGADLSEETFESGNLPFYENRSVLPRARLMSHYMLAEELPGGDDLGSFLDGVQSGRIPVDSLVVVDRVPDPSPHPATEPLSTPEFVFDGLNEVILRTNAPVPALLLLADMTIPGWRVDVDGQPAELLRADLILRAVALTPGEHEVRFTYHESSLQRGLMLTLLGVVCWLILLILPKWVPAMRGETSLRSAGREKKDG